MFQFVTLYNTNRSFAVSDRSNTDIRLSEGDGTIVCKTNEDIVRRHREIKHMRLARGEDVALWRAPGEWPWSRRK